MMTCFLYIIFFLSGMSALIFETIWFRFAGLAFGNSIWSATLILGGFMAGLALGNMLIARYGDLIRNPVKFYSLLEAAVGITGMSLVIMFPFFETILTPVFRPFLDVPYILNPLRLGMAFILIVVPTTAMGATLPVMVNALCGDKENFGRVLGRLYGLNTLGAVAGALAGEIILIKSLGLQGTGLAAALLNFIAAYCAYRFANHYQSQVAAPLKGNKKIFVLKGASRQGKRLLLAAFISGWIMLSLEVVWFRFLLLTRSGTSLIFAVMLSVVLAGIGTGGLIASWLYRLRQNAHSFLRQMSLLCGILIIAAYWGFDRFFNAIQDLNKLSNFTSVMEFFWLALFLMLPVSTVSGIVFTMLGQALREEFESETSAAGMLTLSNTLGAMLGSFFAGFYLLPHLGMEKSFFLLAIGYGVTALIIPGTGDIKAGRRRVMSYAVTLVFTVLIVRFPFGLMPDAYFGIVSKKTGAEKMVAARETLTETVFYFRYDVMGEPLYYRLVTNAHAMSSTEVRAKRYMKLYVYLPAALHPDMKHALLISYGVGSTAKALTDMKELETIDIVDISRDIMEMSSIVYPDPGEYPLNDHRVKTHIEDGRFFLRYTDQRFDLITSEPPPPKLAGIVNLYTQEYFKLMYDRLSEGGIVSYWLPVHSLYEDEAASIMKAFCNVFEDCSLWAGSGLDWMLLGSHNAAGPVPENIFTQQWRDPVVAPELKRLGFEMPGQMGSLFMADYDSLKSLLENSLPLTDNYPLRLSNRSKTGNKFSPLFSVMMDESNAMLRFQKSPFIKRMWPGALIGESQQYFESERTLKNILEPEYRQRADYEWDELYNVLTKTSLKTLPLWILGTTPEELEIAGKKNIDNKYASKIELLDSIREISDRNYNEAARHMEEYFKIVPKDKAVGKYPLYLFTLCMAGEKEKAEMAASELAQSLGNNGSVIKYWNWLNTTFGIRVPLMSGKT